jgi:RNA polymerase primary sigma factor
MTLQNNRGSIDKYLREIARIPLLTPQREIELAQKIQQGDDAARTLMITSNLRLVVTIARGYTDLGLPLLDLISEGNIGLVKAVERFDPAKGVKLSSYAAWWIRQSIKRALDNQSRIIRLPVHHRDKLLKIRRVASRMSQELGREASDNDIAGEVGIDPDKVSYWNAVSVAPASLDALIGDEDLTELGESVADENARSPFEALRDQDLRQKVGDLFGVLSEREKKIVRERFGFAGGRRKTLKEVGAGIGLTRERVRQLQEAAVAKLRHALEQSEMPAETPMALAA